jgi:calcineurin-like phosphoesterase family protein
MADIWVISDLHYNHANILKFVDSKGNRVRPFDTVEQMNEYILEKWNSVVKPGDKVYHLGDVFFGDRDEFKRAWPKFNGSKRLIVGNHDDVKFLASGGFFARVQESRNFTEYGLIMSHRPLHESQLWDHKRDRPMKNVHGHLHQNIINDDRYINVSVEVVDYTPVNIEELRIY